MSRPLRPIERGTASTGPIRLPPQWDGADEVQLETTPRTPAASEAFTPHELEARIEALAEIVAAEQPTETIRGQCWGCGKTPPLLNKGPMHPSKVPGWVVRPQENSMRFSAPEVWCPTCTSMPGFGCVEEPESANDD